MAATILNFLIKGCEIYNGSKISEAFKNKLNVIGVHYSTLSGLKRAKLKELNSFKTQEGNPCFKPPLTTKEFEKIRFVQKEINLSYTLKENFISLLTKNFIQKQLDMIESISIDNFNVNPILSKALNLNTPKDLIEYSAFQAISRSIVTSMGYFVQNLLLFSEENVADGKNYKEGSKTKWDIVIENLNEVREFFEIKSGFNDMDSAQVKHYAEEIEKVEKVGNSKGYIGITYGKKDSETVTKGLLEKYLKDWEEKTLVGKDLWDYVSKEENYHETLLRTIEATAKTVLKNGSILKKIKSKVTVILKDFNEKYPSLDDYYTSLW